MLWEPQILETICHLSVWCCREYSPRPTVLRISELCARYIHPPQLCHSAVMSFGSRSLKRGSWQFLSWLRGFDSAAGMHVFEDIYSTNKWSRTVRQGIMRMHAFCEETLKEKSLSVKIKCLICWGHHQELRASPPVLVNVGGDDQMMQLQFKRNCSPPHLKLSFFWSDLVFFLYVL
jgi:hypothetical protein